MTHDELYMLRALFLAGKGAGLTAPNPLVGAVLVYDNRIIGEGWHQKYGTSHAEPNCINSVREIDKHLISKATLYVSLEPCSHYGKTPPCANLIIQYKIPKVFIACKDPNPKVAGKGIALLEQAGIKVKIGILESEAILLNKRFFTFYQQERPYIILKWAESADGFIAPFNGQKFMLSNALVSRYVHKMRSEEAAILVGFTTALKDNPLLTNRFFGSHQPIRIIIDLKNELPDSLNLKIDTGRTIIYNNKIEKTQVNCQYIKLNQKQNLADQICNDLFKKGINSLIVEGGAKTLNGFINQNLWDEAHKIHTPKIIKEGVIAPKLKSKRLIETLILEDNTIEIYKKIC
ncbi:MAG TPA: bifunctional diaminohydroxyphosphoribosylaminopyrimidine deaminase/5-amino-6-(5-phosphoribosylamino)uracil reductase RibD [Edaphocola sp.]|nr:bifunctional diaminohydroxyphosphoribosylaminopyrimidine deaminase/5-amino-6-(5-phosphoribosylamino)uracil reductase RibD [Edaphocola sp.]